MKLETIKTKFFFFLKHDKPKKNCILYTLDYDIISFVTHDKTQPIVFGIHNVLECG